MFDIVAFPRSRGVLPRLPDEGGRLALTAIDEDAAGSRLGKIEGKQQVPGGDTQLTLHDGTNVLTDSDEYRPKDSIVIDNDDKSVVAHFPYEEGALVTAVRGNHGGKVGEIDAIDITPGSGSNNVGVSMDDGGFETVEEYVVVIDENFTGDEDDEPANTGDDE